MQGLFGRASKSIRLEVCLGARIDQIQPLIEARTEEGCALFTDESKAYNRAKQSNRQHATDKHSAGEFARDDDGDGINEVIAIAQKDCGRG